MPSPITSRRHRSAAAFTLIEALFAVLLAAMAGATLLMGVYSSLQATDESLKETIASGMAQQLMDEAIGNLYCEPGSGGHTVTLGPTTSEAQGKCRERYIATEDYNGVCCQPPKDLWGIALGSDDGQGGLRNTAFQAPSGIFGNWQQQVSVYYVSQTNLGTALPAGQTSNYRAVEVRIVDNNPLTGPRQLVKLRRVVAYVPTM
jgi:type II secretory pathway pseudopilin PulG